MKRASIVFFTLFVTLAAVAGFLSSLASVSAESPPTNDPVQAIRIVVDDFRPQAIGADPIYFYNRLGGDRGALNNSQLDWGPDQVTATIAPSQVWGGVWTSLNHPIAEGQPVDFSALLSDPIAPAYQAQVTAVAVQIDDGTSGRTFRLELKDNSGLRWSQSIILSGGPQTLQATLPPLTDTTELVWVLDGAGPGDYVVVSDVALTATTPVTDTATAAFVWSYGMLLNNWNPATGLVRDKAREPSGAFDAIQATGSLAAATAVAEQIGVVDHSSAVQIVGQISDTLLTAVPRYGGLWPHWVEQIQPTGTITIHHDSEWSSVDTAIAAVGLLAAQEALGLDSSGAESMLAAIDWAALEQPTGLSHGYTNSGTLITYTWDTFGGESWLLSLAYAAATDTAPPLAYPLPPTANGSGFIDELAWLFVQPPYQDTWGAPWHDYRPAAATTQTDFFVTHYPTSCLSQLGLYGLSAAEVPAPAQVPEDEIYQAFGVGGRFAPPNDNVSGMPVAVPHYAAMIASLKPLSATTMWDWLIDPGLISPLNNVESLAFADDSACTTGEMTWNGLKGSWNLALQTLGWGNYLAARNGETPALWQAGVDNAFLHGGYERLARLNHYLPTVINTP